MRARRDEASEGVKSSGLSGAAETRKGIPRELLPQTNGARGGISRCTSASNSETSAIGPKPLGNSFGFSAGDLSKTVERLSTPVPCRAKNPRARGSREHESALLLQTLEAATPAIGGRRKLSPVTATSRPPVWRRARLARICSKVAAACRPSTSGEEEKGGFISTTLGTRPASRRSCSCAPSKRLSGAPGNRSFRRSARVSAHSLRTSFAPASSAMNGQHPRAGGGLEHDVAGAEPRREARDIGEFQRRRELLQRMAFFRASRLARQQRSDLREHRQDARGLLVRAGDHRWTIAAQEQHLRRLERLISVLPTPAPSNVARAKGVLHRRAKADDIDRLAPGE